MKRHLIVTVHGIQTLGRWQEALRDMILSVEPGATIHDYKYSVVSAYSLFPRRREQKVRRFAAELLAQFRREPWDRIDIVAHSLGTFLVAEALRDLAASGRIASLRVHTLIFAGSVLPPDYPWRLLIPAVVGRVVNECGVRDHILWLPALFLFPKLGFGGRVGFEGMTGHDLHNRRFSFGHSGFSATATPRDPDGFMRRWWLPLLTTDARVVGYDERSRRAFPTLMTWLERQITALRIFVWTLLIAVPTGLVARHIQDLAQLNEHLQANSWALQSLQKRETAPIEANRLAIASAGLRNTTQTRHALLQAVATSARPIATLAPRAELIRSVDVDSRGRRLAAAGLNGAGAFVRLYHLVGDAPHEQNEWSLPRAQCSQKQPQTLRFSPSGRYLVLQGFNGSCMLNVWTLSWMDLPGWEHVTFADDDTLFYAASGTTFGLSPEPDNPPLSLFENGKGTPVAGMPRTGWIRDLAIVGRDGVLVADATGRAWLVPGRYERPVRPGPLGDVTSAQVVASSSTAGLLAVGSEHGNIQVLSADGSREMWRASLASAPLRLVFSSDGRQLAALLADGTSRVWSATDGMQLASFDTAGIPLDLRFVGHDHNQVLTVSRGAGVKVWGVREQTLLVRVPTPVANDAYGFDDAGGLVIALDDDGSATLWNTSWRGSGPRLYLQAGIEQYVVAGAGRFIAALGADEQVKVWDTSQDRIVLEVPGETDGSAPRPSLAMSDDGTTVAVAGLRGRVRVWKSGRGLVFDLQLPKVFAEQAASAELQTFHRYLPQGTDPRLLQACAAEVGVVGGGRARRHCWTWDFDEAYPMGTISTDPWAMHLPIALSRRGEMLAMTFLDDVLLFDVGSGSLRSKASLGYEARRGFLAVEGTSLGIILPDWIGFSGDGHLLAASKATQHPEGNEGGNAIWTWPVQDGSSTARKRVLGSTHSELKLLAAIDSVMSLSQQRTQLNLWNAAALEQQRSIQIGRHIDAVIHPASSPESLVVLSHEQGRPDLSHAFRTPYLHVDVLSSVSLQRSAHLAVPLPAQRIALAPGGGELFVEDGRGNVRMLDMQSGEVLSEFVLGTVPKALWLGAENDLYFTSGGQRAHVNVLASETYIGSVVWQTDELVRLLCATLRPFERDFSELGGRASKAITCSP